MTSQNDGANQDYPNERRTDTTADQFQAFTDAVATIREVADYDDIDISFDGERGIVVLEYDYSGPTLSVQDSLDDVFEATTTDTGDTDPITIDESDETITLGGNDA